MNKNKNNSSWILIVIILIIIGGVWFLNSNYKDQKSITPPQNSNDLIYRCFYRSTQNEDGFYNIAYLKSSILEDKIRGDFYHLPAETDSKVGSFEGEISKKDDGELSSKVWWNSFAEGMSIKEELVIKLKENTATVGFGEMKDRGDGVYIYKNPLDLYYIENMPEIDCGILEEKLLVEEYLRKNINQITTNNEVAGENWHVISVLINPSTQKGELTYENENIQSRANISYSYNNITKEIKINSFIIIQ